MTRGSRDVGRASSRPRQRLLHGWDWQDAGIELMEIPQASRVLCVTGAGETIAAMAAAGHHVTAVGANLQQLEYARRRIAGAAFEVGSAERLMDIGRGLVRAATPAWSKRRMRSLLEIEDAARAGALWHDRFDNRTFASILKATLGPAGSLAAAVQRDFARALPAHFDDAIRRRIGRALAKHAPASNRFAWRLLLGEELAGWRLPSVREGSITWVERSAIAHLESVAPGSYDAITLSNIVDGADDATVRAMRKAAIRAVQPGGPIITRSFATTVDDDAARRARRDRSMLWGAIIVQR